MTDVENSDDERYGNESFENESDTEVPDMSEFENESTANSDDDDPNLSSVKMNTGPIKRNNYNSNLASINKTDVVPFASSSEEEDDVVVGETLAEINTPSMLFEDETSTPAAGHSSFDEETKESSEEISEEEDEEEEEIKRIKYMEEKYMQQLSAKAMNTNIANDASLENIEQNDIQESPKDETEYESGADTDEDQETVFDDPTSQEDNDKIFLENDKASGSCGPRENVQDNVASPIDQTKLIKLIASSLSNLKMVSSNDNDENLLNLPQTQTVNGANATDADTIAVAVVNTLKASNLKNIHTEDKPESLIKDSDDMNNNNAQKLSKDTNSNSCKANETEVVPYKDDSEQGKDTEVEQIQNNDNYNNENYIYYDAHITSKTPTSFNSDDYIFHANFIKQFHRTSSTDKLRPKPHPRKSMSFSNERMREIERHNQILLRKILTQRPTYTLKSKSSQSSLQKLPSQTNTRITTSAVNRKKQQRQIDLENQVLKRKIEAIALRRSQFIT